MSVTTMSKIEAGVAAESQVTRNHIGRNIRAIWLGSMVRGAFMWRAAINYLMPIGYEDETGFHYGDAHVSNPSSK
jgi:hypothetical protein